MLAIYTFLFFCEELENLFEESKVKISDKILINILIKEVGLEENFLKSKEGDYFLNNIKKIGLSILTNNMNLTLPEHPESEQLPLNPPEQLKTSSVELETSPAVRGIFDDLAEGSFLNVSDHESDDEDFRVISNLWDVLENPEDSRYSNKKYSPRYRYIWRWTEHGKNDLSLFKDPESIKKKMIEMLSLKRLVFQLEKGPETGKLHYQGFLVIGSKLKKRPKDVISVLRSKFFGIEVRP